MTAVWQQAVWVLVRKYVDHLPLYRLEQIAARAGVALSCSTLAVWVGRYGVALQSLVDRLQTLLKERNVLRADETQVQQLAPQSPGATSLSRGATQRAYSWAHCNGELEERVNALSDSHRTALPAVVL